MKTKHKFRLQAKILFLTYPQFNADISFDIIHKQIDEKLKLNKYLFVFEKHETKGVHLHCYIELFKRCDIKNPNLLNLSFDSKTYHGNYQRCKDRLATLKYLNKNYLSFETNIELDKDFNELTIIDKCINKSSTEGVLKALIYYIENSTPQERYKNLSKLKRCLLIEQEVRTTYNSNIGLVHEAQPDNWPIDLTNWVNNLKNNKTIVTFIYGKSGTGKTQAILNILKTVYSEFELLYIRGSIEGLKNYDRNKHKCIIIDEFNPFIFKSVDELKGFLDSIQPTYVNVKYSSIEIEPSVFKVLISNNSFKEILDQWNTPISPEDIKALLRRIKPIIQIEYKLYKLLK